MSTIKADAVKRLFAAQGFRYSFGLQGSKFTYGEPGEAELEFSAPWLRSDPLNDYDLAEVRRMLTSMMESARAEYGVKEFLSDQANVDALTSELVKFGMVFDETDRYFYYVRDGKAVFGVDLDYLASMMHTGKTDMAHIQETLSDMLETADYEAGERERIGKMENGKKE